MIVAIHQPNFVPWLGYFRKIACADAFAFLDAVAFSKGSWTNRVRLLVAGRARWVTCPVRQALGQPIDQVHIDECQPWREKLVKTLETNYGRAGSFRSVMGWLADLIRWPTDLLADFNVRCIVEIACRLGLQCRFVRQSEMAGASDQKGSAALAHICRHLKADTYLAGDGADGYEDPSAYEAAGIRMSTSRFRPQRYPQVGSREFVPGLSILDALFNVGPDRTRSLLLSEVEGL